MNSQSVVQRLIGFLFSGSFMGALLIFFSVSIAWATFIENDYDATAAKALVYGTWWFEAVLGLMVLNFTGMIFTRHLYMRSKLNIMLIHLALVVIIIGAGITRYFGFEGSMHIRNGQTTNQFVSTENFLNMAISDGSQRVVVNERVLLTNVKEHLLKKKIDFYGKQVSVEVEKYIPNAIRVTSKNSEVKPAISMVVAGPSGRKDLLLAENTTETLEDFGISFGDTTNTRNIWIIRQNNRLLFKSPYPVMHSDMNTGHPLSLPENEYHLLAPMNIYTIEGVQMVFKELVESGEVAYEPAPDQSGKQYRVAQLRIVVDGIEQTIMTEIGFVGHNHRYSIGDLDFDVNLGAQIFRVPFFIRLDQFSLDRYPGSESPSSFASDITLIDEKKELEMPYRIYMNNVLNYGGYRFFQSSYDTDEQGTILSVNWDKWGTLVTYFGYFLLISSMIMVLFTRKTHFAWLSQQIKRVHEERKILKLGLGVLILSTWLFHPASSQSTAQDLGSIDKAHAEAFGELLVQNRDGRVMPANTLANQLLVKIYKKDHFQNLEATQVYLGMTAHSEQWQSIELITVRDPEIKNILGIRDDNARLNDFLDEKGGYKLKDLLQSAYGKEPAKRTKFDKELLATDERANVGYMILSGAFLKIYPLPEHPDQKWGNQSEYLQYLKTQGTSPEAVLFTDYVHFLKEAIESGNYNQANQALASIKEYQQKYGGTIIPPTAKVQMEIIYNKVNIFKKLFPFYLILGITLLGIFLLQLLYPSLELKKIVNGTSILLAVLFLIHTLGLALRWYLAGHAPWSNGYESMIYIAWATVLAGFLFRSTSAITLSVTSILAGITLLTAHMSWLNPEITNLVPVLKSYWLTIHVATITASYGFLALGCLLGFLNLVLMIIRNEKNVQRVSLTINELTYTIEMSLMVGLILLVIGNFLGGVWANESWGRYWGWDPKETWSLITIIVYTFILHTRMIPKLKSTFSTSFMATIGFSSVLMTYFGVNYYLSGLHSYAQGDPVPIPTFVYVTLLVVLLVASLAGANEIILRRKKVLA